MSQEENAARAHVGLRVVLSSTLFAARLVGLQRRLGSTSIGVINMDELFKVLGKETLFPHENSVARWRHKLQRQVSAAADRPAPRGALRPPCCTQMSTITVINW